MSESQRAALSFAEVMQGITPEERGELAAFSHFYQNNVEFRRFISAPHLSQEQRHNLIRKALEPLCSQTTIEHLLFLETLDGFSLLPSILIHLEDRQDVENGVLTTAEPLSSEAVAQLKTRFEELIGHKILLEQKTDPGLIGGFLITVGNRVYDSTIKQSLHNLKKYLGKTPCN
jgi:F-type H+-transporting ATPase subunit delta